MNDNVATSSYDLITNSPSFWIKSADSLKVSSEFLLPHGLTENNSAESAWSVRRTINMLYAMSIECALKAVYLSVGCRIAQDGKMKKPTRQPWEVNGTHDLIGLASSLEKHGVNFSEDEFQFLTEIQPFIELGRYPTRSKCNSPNPGCMVKNTNGKGYLGTNYPAVPWCDTSFSELFIKLNSKVECEAQTAENAPR